MSQKGTSATVCGTLSHAVSYLCLDTPPPQTQAARLYLVGGGVKVGQGDVQQVVLQRVDPRGNRQLQRLDGFVGNFLTQNAVQSSPAIT